jgi:hypothetical protein
MKKSKIVDLLFASVALLVLAAIPYLILSWNPTGGGRVVNVAGYNLADPDPGIWLVNEGRPYPKEASNILRVKSGELITLRLSSMDVVHGFSIDEYNISEIIMPGEIVSVEFVAGQGGEFEFYCSARSCGPGHLDMRGTLIVEP